MGNTKSSTTKRFKSSYISPKSLLYINDDFTPAYSTFYHFTRWITNFNFFTEITDNDEATRLVVMKDGPNDYNIYQIIKAIDEIEPKNIINEFSFCDYLDLNSEEESDDNSRKGIVKKYNDFKFDKEKKQCRSNGANLPFMSQNEFKIKVSGLINTLYTTARKKFDKILMKGPPNNLRWFMWMSLVREKYNVVEQETRVTNEQFYSFLIQNTLKKEVETDILQNLQSCLYDISYYFESDKIDHLYNLLRAIALYDKDIGYNRIINKIAAYVLIVSNFNEAEAFLMVRYILSSEYGLGLHELILEDTPRLLLFNYIMRFFIEERMPNVNEVIKDFGIQNKLWFTSWVQSLFIDKMPFGVCIRIWDCLFVKKLPFFYNYILGLIKYYENDLIDAKNDSNFIEKLHIQLRNEDDVVLFREKLINLSEGFTITPKMISEVEEKYFKSSQATALNLSSSSKQEKEMEVIMKIISKAKRRDNKLLQEKEAVEYDPESLSSLDDLEINEEGYLANKSSSTDDEIANIEIREEYINIENEFLENEFKKPKAKTEKIKPIVKFKQNIGNKLQDKNKKNISFNKMIKEENGSYNDKNNGIKRDGNISDFSFEESEL